MDGTKYFLLNKKEDFVKQQGYFCSKPMDSGEKQTKWSRIHIQWNGLTKHIISVHIFAAEQYYLIWKGKKRGLPQIMEDRDIPMEEKLVLYAHACSGRADAQDGMQEKEYLDCLLNQVTGRYLWVVVQLAPGYGEKLFLPEIQIFFQAQSWLYYLPEIYGNPLQKDTFLFRYLSIFQWIYYDMSEKISEMPHMLYPAFADTELLEWMSSWFDIDDRTVWNREQLIYLLENGSRLYSIRGTKKYMEEIIHLYTGYIPFIVEYYQTACYKTDIKKTWLLENLYGESAYMITIVLPGEAVANGQEAVVLRKIIRSAAPADIECRLVFLEPYIFLDHYTYVGVNSRLGGYKDAALDGKGLTPYISMAEDKNERSLTGEEFKIFSI